MSKKGITGLALTIYCALFFLFTAFTLSISSTYNSNMFARRGMTINLTTYEKLVYYMQSSAMDSYQIHVIDSSILFSNGDEYIYDSVSRTITRNGGIIANNVTQFSAEATLGVDSNRVEVGITFAQYTKETVREIVLYAGG